MTQRDKSLSLDKGQGWFKHFSDALRRKNIDVYAKQCWLNNVGSLHLVMVSWHLVGQRCSRELFCHFGLLLIGLINFKCLMITMSGFQYLFREYCFDIDIRGKLKLQFGKLLFEFEFTRKVLVRFLCPLWIKCNGCLAHFFLNFNLLRKSRLSSPNAYYK